MGRLFGTDGARGIANKDLSCELAMQIGRAAAMVLIDEKNKHPKVMIGMDTRKSGDMLESAIAAGLCSLGANVVKVGVVPTPALAFLVKECNCDAGIMISASHNPCEYNGIKIFKSDGYKLQDSLEEEIEAIILDDVKIPQLKIGGEVGTIERDNDAIELYIRHIKLSSEVLFKGKKIALDCANGSASVSAEKIFSDLGAECVIVSNNPDGVNINANCGSTHLENVRKAVLENNCDLGFAFDGDADRLLAVDGEGNFVDGDKIIAICAKYMMQEGKLKDNTAVVTVMSNMGFFEFCKTNSINCETTKVGDRYVLENMLENGYVLGGEQSGHVIFLEHATTGDGQLTAVMLMNVIMKTNKTLKELADEMEVFPQVLINVKVSEYGKSMFPTDEEIKIAIKGAEKELGEAGRVLVRVSGTEPLIRVMLEGKDLNKIERLGNSIAEVIKERLM